MTRKLGTLTIYRTRYLLDDVVDGDFPRGDWNTDTTTLTEVSASEAARIISDAGLSFAASGGSWASNPDGSYTSNYATGEETEESAHLSDFPDRLVNAIIQKVG
jgi:hypothetical protein